MYRGSKFQIPNQIRYRLSTLVLIYAKTRRVLRLAACNVVIMLLVLRRVDDAIAAQDPIRAIIRRTGSNQDGHQRFHPPQR